MTLFLRLVWRELALSARHTADASAALLFFVIAGSLFPFALGGTAAVLAPIAAAIVLVCAALAALLPLNRLFAADFEDGSLDQLLLGGLPASAVAGAKMLAHWLITGVPLLVVAAPLSIMLRLPPEHLPRLFAALVPTTILLSLVGGMGAAVTLGARQAAALMPLITLPLMIPPLIFAAAAASAPHPEAPALMLGALLALALPFAPLAAGAALRAASE
jgi:heme exporter protein B